VKILSWNVNGIRAVHGRDFLGWLAGTGADIVCLQETKAQPEQLVPELIRPEGYHSYFNSAVKKGYSGVAVYTKEKPLKVKDVLGHERFDSEGRLLELHYKDLVLMNLYLPQGGRQKENLDYKLEVYSHLIDHIRRFRDKNLVLIGDFNIAHTELDLARPKQNMKNIMFTPEERERLSSLLGLGLVDTFRQFNNEGGNYTWWPYFVNARQRNLGWRIDYTFTSQALTARLKRAFILPDVMGSDHCPIGIELE
jgi:exodeoxyribonuclease-3